MPRALLFIAITVGIVLPLAAKADVEAQKEPANTFALLEQRYVAQLLTEPVEASHVRNLLTAIQADGRWPDIDYEDLSRTGFEHQRHLQNLTDLARAYRQSDSAFHGDIATRKAALAALDFWLEHKFVAANWWWNEIGTPERLSDALLLLAPELSNAQLEQGLAIVAQADLNGRGARPGGDSIRIAEIVFKRGILARDRTVAEQAREIIADQIHVTTGRGIQPDFSFHHRTDGIITTTSYGRSFAGSAARYAARTQGTIFALPDDKLALLIDFKLDGIRWTLAHGTYPSPASMNRELSRPGYVRSTPWAAPHVLRDLLIASDYRRDELEALAAVRAGERKPTWSGNRYFWRSAYMAHQRRDYHAAVRMFSSRNHSVGRAYNNEGLRNHHLADGSIFLTRTGDEYRDIFPAWDWQKIPGTTVLQKSALPDADIIRQRGRTEFVGGVSDGMYGAAAFDFQSPLDPLKARKAWFFFDDAFVALGAGIVSGAEGNVATTLNQCRLAGDVTMYGGGQTRTLGSDNHRLSDVAWVHHDEVAYIFPDPIEVKLQNTAVTGNWRRITRQERVSQEPVTEDVFKLWIDHGQSPQQASYAYIVAPGLSVDEVSHYQQQQTIRILANTPEHQAVQHADLQLTQIVFYTPGQLKLTDAISVQVDQPCLVMVQMADNRVQQITVCDPTQQHAEINMKVTARLAGAEQAWNASAGRTHLHFELPQDGFAGQSVQRHFPGRAN